MAYPRNITLNQVCNTTDLVCGQRSTIDLQLTTSWFTACFSVGTASQTHSMKKIGSTCEGCAKCLTFNSIKSVYIFQTANYGDLNVILMRADSLNGILEFATIIMIKYGLEMKKKIHHMWIVLVCIYRVLAWQRKILWVLYLFIDRFVSYSIFFLRVHIVWNYQLLVTMDQRVLIRLKCLSN